MVERHPRSAFELVTKMPLRDFKDTADLETPTLTRKENTR